MQAYPYIVPIHCFIIHFRLLRAFNFNLELFCTLNFFVSLSFTGVIELIWLECNSANFWQLVQFAYIQDGHRKSVKFSNHQKVNDSVMF